MTTYYVDATAGDDEAAGTEVAPWKTIAKVNATSVNPGDSILFKRGETWRENLWVGRTAHNGVDGAYVTFGAYGTGAKPRILGSKLLSTTGDWADQGSNVWKTAATIDTAFEWEGNDVSCVLLNGGTSYGNREATLVACDAQGDYFFDTSAEYLYMYSVGNPATYYSAVEACTRRYAVYLHGASYDVLENLYLGHTSGMGVMSVVVDSGGLYIPNHIVIQDCNFAWVVNWDGATGGYAIQPYQSANNWIVRRNTFDKVSFACFSPQTYNNAATVEHLYCYQNVATECRKLVEYWVVSYSGASCNDIIVAHNAAYNLGADPATNGSQEDEKAAGLTMFSGCVVPTNFRYVNNITHTTGDHHLYIKGADAEESYCEMVSGAGTLIDYNCYYPDSAQTVRGGNAGGETYTLAQWQTASAAAGYAMDAHSIVTDPGLTSDFHLSSASSPCYDTGTNAGLNLPYLGTTWDRGVYEYNASGVLKRCPFRKAV